MHSRRNSTKARHVPKSYYGEPPVNENAAADNEFLSDGSFRERRCVVCREIRPIAEFRYYTQTGNSAHRCNICVKHGRNQYRKGRGRRGPIAKVFQAIENEHPGVHLRCRVHGISVFDYLAMLRDQEGQCAVCGEDFEGHTKSPSIDHDHSTGKVRALLCNLCNSAIGHLKDDPERCRQAAAYLEFHQSR